MAGSTEQSVDSNSVQPRSPLARFAQAHPLTLFFLLAYAWTWTVWLILPRIIHRRGLGANFETIDIILLLLGAFGPTVAAFVTQYLAHRNLKICRVWTGWVSLFRGLWIGFFLFFIAIVIAPSLALVNAPLRALHWSVLLHWSTYAVNWSTFLGGPVNEEPGWRGFALPRMQARYGPYWASAIFAPLWAAWHLPLFLIPGWNTASPGQYVLILLGISFLMTAAANLARFGVIVPIVMHAFFNTSSGLGNAMMSGLPARAREMWIYTLVVCVCGAGLGTVVLSGSAIPPKDVRGEFER